MIITSIYLVYMEMSMSANMKQCGSKPHPSQPFFPSQTHVSPTGATGEYCLREKVARLGFGRTGLGLKSDETDKLLENVRLDVLQRQTSAEHIDNLLTICFVEIQRQTRGEPLDWQHYNR